MASLNHLYYEVHSRAARRRLMTQAALVRETGYRLEGLHDTLLEVATVEPTLSPPSRARRREPTAASRNSTVGQLHLQARGHVGMAGFWPSKSTSVCCCRCPPRGCAPRSAESAGSSGRRRVGLAHRHAIGAVGQAEQHHVERSGHGCRLRGGRSAAASGPAAAWGRAAGAKIKRGAQAGEHGVLRRRGISRPASGRRRRR